MLEIEVQGARQVAQTMPDAIRIFIAPPSRGDAAHAADRPRHTTTPSRSSAGCGSPRPSSPPQDEFAHVVHNDRLEDAADELERIVREAL